MKLGIKEHRKGENKESVTEKNKKEAKESFDFKKAEEQNQTETSNESNNKNWSSNALNIKGADPQDNIEVTSSTGPIVDYQEGHNIPAKVYKINLSEKIYNLIYNGNTTELYIDKQERIKPESSNNHETDRSDIYLDKPKQEVQRNDQGEQEVRQTETMKKIAENGEIHVELVVDSPGVKKTNSEIQQDLVMREENKQQHAEETTMQKA